MAGVLYENVLLALNKWDSLPQTDLVMWEGLYLFQYRQHAYPTKISTLHSILEDSLAILHSENAHDADVLYRRFWERGNYEKVARDLNVESRTSQRYQQQAIKNLTRIINDQEARSRQTVSISCGDDSFDLTYRRPFVSTQFGSYFTSMFEMTNGYLQIDGQIDCPSYQGIGLLPPLQKIQYLFRLPKGPRIIFLAGNGGSGKTTLAVKLLKCLFSEEDADFILGESAKTAIVDVNTGDVKSVLPGFYNSQSFYHKIYQQLGLPENIDFANTRLLLKRIKSRLKMNKYRAVLILDNLETLNRRDVEILMNTLRPLLCREIRVLITTRNIEYMPDNTYVVNLRPLSNLTVRPFLEWHIHQHSEQIEGLSSLAEQLDGQKAEKLAMVSGGIPLIIQLLLSNVCLYSWAYLDRPLPIGVSVLEFLYQQHWDEFSQQGAIGIQIQALAKFVVTRQKNGQMTLLQDIQQWGSENSYADVAPLLKPLQDRFLIIQRGNLAKEFVTFPSFIDFVEMKGG